MDGYGGHELAGRARAETWTGQGRWTIFAKPKVRSAPIYGEQRRRPRGRAIVAPGMPFASAWLGLTKPVRNCSFSRKNRIFRAFSAKHSDR